MTNSSFWAARDNNLLCTMLLSLSQVGANLCRLAFKGDQEFAPTQGAKAHFFLTAADSFTVSRPPTNLHCEAESLL